MRHRFGWWMHRGADALWDEYVDELKEKMAERFPLLVKLEGLGEPLCCEFAVWESRWIRRDQPAPPEVVKRRARWKEPYETREQ